MASSKIVPIRAIDLAIRKQYGSDHEIRCAVGERTRKIEEGVIEIMPNGFRCFGKKRDIPNQFKRLCEIYGKGGR